MDSLFEAKPSDGFKRELSADDLRGCIGEYWHGNEPSHHVIYLYRVAPGCRGRRAERLHQVVATQYGNAPGSLCGNDDCGQMSAWYLFTLPGFLPGLPGEQRLHHRRAASFPREMHLSNGKIFTMTAENLSDQNIYVQSVQVNGKDWDAVVLPI